MIQHKQMPPLTDSQRALVCDGERVDYLLREEAYIIQNPAYFPFSLDAVLLADFVKLPKKKALRVMDFCTGGGVIPILLAHRTSARIEGIEIQGPIAEMAQRTVKLNGLSHQVTIHQGDIKDLTKPKQEYDLITCNPPFFYLWFITGAEAGDPFSHCPSWNSIKLGPMDCQGGTLIKG